MGCQSWFTKSSLTRQPCHKKYCLGRAPPTPCWEKSHSLRCVKRCFTQQVNEGAFLSGSRMRTESFEVPVDVSTNHFTHFSRSSIRFVKRPTAPSISAVLNCLWGSMFFLNCVRWRTRLFYTRRSHRDVDAIARRSMRYRCDSRDDRCDIGAISVRFARRSMRYRCDSRARVRVCFGRGRITLHIVFFWLKKRNL